MAPVEIAVQGMELEIVSTNPADNVQGVVAITGAPSSTVKANGNGIYVDGLTVSVTNITAPGANATIPDPGPKTGSFSSTSSAVENVTIRVLREGDETGTINATPKIPSTPSAIDYPTSFKIRIKTAGQTAAKAE